MSGKIIRALFIATALLIIPLLASFFTDGWLWTGSDYVFAWIMFFLVSLGFIAVVGGTNNTSYKLGSGLAIIAIFLLVWINGAVGIIGDGDLDSPNGMYAGVLLVGIIGALISRFRPRGMSYTVFAMAIAQMLVPLITYAIPSLRGELMEPPGLVGVFILNAIFMTLFAGAGVFFWQAETENQR